MLELHFRHAINSSTFQVHSKAPGVQVKIWVQFSGQFKKNKTTEKERICLSEFFFLIISKNN